MLLFSSAYSAYLFYFVSKLETKLEDRLCYHAGSRLSKSPTLAHVQVVLGATSSKQTGLSDRRSGD